ncbi:hypothetical protein GCM10025870_10210 [Agromyces marinus]|uniref:Molybdopterin-binding domain of aldehyde dehydrogenase n=1 Tax=Agromyces marinus TaxID=1389020 RepID=A0ABM8GZQ4_9MICO|nr:hypothetical protein GCM10025870_10210 [Agromyces marinus]
MGGGFGGKEMQPHGFAAVAAIGAQLTGRPVRVRLTRTQDLTMTGKRHPFHATWRAGFDDDGRILALETTLTADGGWSLDLSEPVLGRALLHVDNAYFIPDVTAHGRIAKTNKTSQTAFRGFGGPQGMFVVEDLLGRVAPLLGIPADVLRERNLYAPGQSTPYGQPVRHAERLRAMWADLRDSADLDARRDAIARSNAADPDLKRGLAITPVKFGISFTFTSYNQAGALVHVYRDGSVLVNHGGTEMGQGLHTKMLQVAATALGVPIETVRLAPTRTDKVPNTSATAASSGADLNGGAIKHACEQIRGRLASVAAGLLGLDEHDVRFGGGRVGVLGRARSAWAAPMPIRPRRSRSPRSPPPPTTSACSCGPRASTAPQDCTGTPTPCRANPSSTSRTASPRPRSRSTGSRARRAPCASTSCTTSATRSRRSSTSARSRAASCRAPDG